MKKIYFFLLLLSFSIVKGQVNIVNFTVKNTLPSKIDEWITTPGALILIAQRTPQPGANLKAILVVQIRSGGAVICGNNAASSRPLDPFDLRTFNTADLTGLLGNCKELKEGSYTICAQFFDPDRHELSREVCKEFRVEGAKNDYAPPTLITPENGKQFSLKQLEGLLTFRWTPVVPKPRDAVVYKLRVWQLMQGQNGMQAMRSNNPVVSKDVENLTQTTVNNLLTGPCKPPYLCDFIWNVQAVNREGKGYGSNNGTSEPSLFSASQYIIQLDSIKVSCSSKAGVYNFSYTITNPNGGPATLNSFTITSSVPAGATIASFAPPINTVISSGSQLTITGTINASPILSNICIGAEIKDVGNSFWKASKDTCTRVTPCPCDPCRDMLVTVQKDSLIIPKNGNPMQLNLTGMFSGLNLNLIKKVTAEIVYFNIQQTKDTNCAKCVYDSKYYGNFILPASALPGYNGPVLNKPDYSRLLTWTSSIIKDCNGQPDGGDHGGVGDPMFKVPGIKETPRQNPNDAMQRMSVIGGPGNPPPPVGQGHGFILPIAVPEMSTLSCCGDIIKICIRYTFYDFCCHACEVIKCYEIKREK